ncbi:MAG: AMP phosphotransferase [Gammaproteobacteria bacterium]|nr:AMP phosphotransferase [Gammaproteobacteria bacterium]
MHKKAELGVLQQQLALLQQAMSRQQQSTVIVMEGQDAAGKGGIIRRVAWCLDPRWLHVWPISAPNETEQQQHWLQRFWHRLPQRGHVAVFDRSWYGRVLVERVEGFCDEAAWLRAYQQINAFEASLQQEGIHLVKIWLEISEEEQLKRFRKRFEDPAKSWKLTAEDLRNRARWQDYQEAKQDMLLQTNTKDAPWHQIDGNDKAQARVDCFQLLLDGLTPGTDLTLPEKPALFQDFFSKNE